MPNTKTGPSVLGASPPTSPSNMSSALPPVLSCRTHQTHPDDPHPFDTTTTPSNISPRTHETCRLGMFRMLNVFHACRWACFICSAGLKSIPATEHIKRTQAGAFYVLGVSPPLQDTSTPCPTHRTDKTIQMGAFYSFSMSRVHSLPPNT